MLLCFQDLFNQLLQFLLNNTGKSGTDESVNEDNLSLSRGLRETFSRITETEGHLAFTKACLCSLSALSGQQRGLEVICSTLLVNGKNSSLVPLFLCHSDKHFDIILQIMEYMQKGKTETV